MAPKLRGQLASDPSLLNFKDDRGWTLLHTEALAGSVPTVEMLLACGANKDALTNDQRTPAQLAQTLGWDKVVALLS